jgi:Stage II sporulation protein E (SpoIIE)
VSPFKSLRRQTRAFGVRVLAGAAVFCTLAIALIAATAAGPLAVAQDPDIGAPAQGTPDPALAPEPVLGAEEVTPAPVPPPEPAPAAVEEPVVQEPVQQPAEEPAAQSAEAPGEQAPPDEPATLRVPEPDDEESEPDDEESEPGDEESAEESSRGEDGSRGEDTERGRPDDEPWRGEEPPEESWTGDGPGSNRERGGGEGWQPPADGQWGGEGQSAQLLSGLGEASGATKGEGSGVAALTSTGTPIAVIAPATPDLGDPPTDAGTQAGGPGTPGSGTTGSGTSGSGTQGGNGPGSDGGSVDAQPSPAPAPAPSGSGGGSSSSSSGGTAGTTPSATGGVATDGFVPAPAADADAFADPVGQSEGSGDGSANPVDERAPGDEPGDGPASIVRQPLKVVDNVPDSLKYALAALAALSVMLGVGYLLATMRARSLARQRRELLQEVGLLQSALLPPVPEKLGSLRTSVAYRPADGPGAGGDFYDVLPLAGGSVGFILGDVSGHGRGALARTAFMRYTLRAYLEAGLEPRAALQVAGRVIDENLGGDFATVLLAVHDPETGSLTYATAGHPAPIVVGPETHHPVTAGSSPPIGVGVPTGLRQTTVPLVPGAVACLFTDGLMDARVGGGVLGRGRLEELLRDLGSDATARELIERVTQESRVLSDDIAAVVVSPTNGVAGVHFRTEQLELSARELEGPIAHRFLASCGVSPADTVAVVAKARAVAGTSGAVILNVVYSDGLRVDVLPRDADSIEAASQRAAAR